MVVLEMDQWRACDRKQIEKHKLTDFEGLEDKGFFTIDENKKGSPAFGMVWFKQDETTGKMVWYMANIDSSG